MAINKSMRRVLKALSFDGIEVEASRHLANLKAIDPMKIFHKTIDYKIYNGNHQIPVRIFLPGEKMEDDLPVFLFFHQHCDQRHAHDNGLVCSFTGEDG